MILVRVDELNVGDEFLFDPLNETNHEDDLLVGRLFHKKPYLAVFEGWTDGHSCNRRLSGSYEKSGWYMMDNWLVEPIRTTDFTITSEVFDDVF